VKHIKLKRIGDHSVDYVNTVVFIYNFRKSYVFDRITIDTVKYQENGCQEPSYSGM